MKQPAGVAEVTPWFSKCEASGKRCFDSVRGARSANRTLSNRLRVYRCEACGSFHISNADENPPNYEQGRRARAAK